MKQFAFASLACFAFVGFFVSFGCVADIQEPTPTSTSTTTSATHTGPTTTPGTGGYGPTTSPGVGGTSPGVGGYAGHGGQVGQSGAVPGVTDSWGRLCSNGADDFDICVDSAPADQVVFQYGHVPGGTHLPDPEVVTHWEYSASVYANTACIENIRVCGEDSLRWQAEFTSPDKGLPNNQWFTCSMYQPIVNGFAVLRNGLEQPHDATYMVQNAAPKGDGRNCQND